MLIWRNRLISSRTTCSSKISATHEAQLSDAEGSHDEKLAFSNEWEPGHQVGLVARMTIL
jgi:hypothetical protein